MARRHPSVLLHRVVRGLIPLFAASATLIGQRASPQPAPVFRSGVNLVLVDVVVRDRSPRSRVLGDAAAARDIAVIDTYSYPQLAAPRGPAEEARSR